MSILSKNPIILDLFKKHVDRLVELEGIDASAVEQGVAEGTMVLLGNPGHAGIVPILIGQPAGIKVNANIGTSPFLCDPNKEIEKLKLALKHGADTIMDLSIGGDLSQIRQIMLGECPAPLGTVPIYGAAQQYIAKGESPSHLTGDDLIGEIEMQAEQGVDFMTLHCGVTRRSASLARDGSRILGIVSRGGSLTAKWMEENDQENPLYERFDEVLQICRKHNVVISLGDGLRPGAGADAGDAAQWEEVIVLGELTRRAWEAGVQVMIEGPGHVPLHQVQAQIQGIKRLCHGAPLYVLGPLTTDCSPGYDHMAGAIGGAMAGFFGADFLCYLTPAEHLTLPDAADVRQGVMASRLAAHSAEVALGRDKAVQRNLAMSRARMDLDWDKMAELALDPDMVRERRKDFSHKKECAMCGEFCAVKLMQ